MPVTKIEPPATALLRARCALLAGVFSAGLALLAPVAVTAAPPPVTVPEAQTAPAPAPEAAPTPAPSPAPLDLPPAPMPQPSRAAAPVRTAPAPSASASAAPTSAAAASAPVAPLPAGDAQGATSSAISTLPDYAPAQPVPASPAAPAAAATSNALGASLLPAWWPWAAGGLAVIAVLILGGLALRHARAPKVLQLAAPPASAGAAASADNQALARLDCHLAITSAARSVMMVSLDYRLEITNRSSHAVRDLAITLRLGYPGNRAENGALADTAEDRQTIPRIGPQQSRSITGTLRLPLAAIAPLRQGRAPLLIPLVDALLSAAGQTDNKRLFVVGTPSPGNPGRLQPIRLDTAPGGIAGLRALPVNAPVTAAQAMLGERAPSG